MATSLDAARLAQDDREGMGGAEGTDPSTTHLRCSAQDDKRMYALLPVIPSIARNPCFGGGGSKPPPYKGDGKEESPRPTRGRGGGKTADEEFLIG